MCCLRLWSVVQAASVFVAKQEDRWHKDCVVRDSGSSDGSNRKLAGSACLIRHSRLIPCLRASREQKYTLALVAARAKRAEMVAIKLLRLDEIIDRPYEPLCALDEVLDSYVLVR